MHVWVLLFRSKAPPFLCVLSFYMAHGRRGKWDGVGESGRSLAPQVQLVSRRPQGLCRPSPLHPYASSTDSQPWFYIGPSREAFPSWYPAARALAYAWHRVSCFRAEELEVVTSALCTGHSSRGSDESPGHRMQTLGFKAQLALLVATISFS